jgi:flagellar basal body-associated protein FliL
MKKIILIAAGAAVVLSCGIGTAAYLTMSHHSTKTAKAVPAPPKPIYFAQLADIVVSVPTDTNDSSNAYVQMTIQFSTFDQNAVTTFTNLEPIIKSQIISLLMAQTAKSLIDPGTHAALTKQCLDISNHVLNASANYNPPNPFTAGYITNLVEQD